MVNKLKCIKKGKSIISIRNVSFSEFKKNASFFLPHESKVLVQGKKPIAEYSAKKRRVRKC